MDSQPRRPDDRGPRTPAGVISHSRIEAFSDGVIAVAITLLVLNLTVPAPDGGGALGQKLLAEWPRYLAYVISFVAIGIFWINHHTMLRRLIGVDHSILVFNIALLLCIVLIPFTTSLLATYLDAPAGGHLAAMVYAGTLVVTSSVFLAMQHHVLTRRTHLLRERQTSFDRRAILRRSAVAPPAYLVAGMLGLVTPYLTLVGCIVLGIVYLRAPRGQRPEKSTEE